MTVRARWLDRFGDEAALTRRLAWDERDAAWLEAAPGLLLAGMQGRAVYGMASLLRLDPAITVVALGSTDRGPDRDALTASFCRVTGWCPAAVAPLVHQAVLDGDAAGGGPVQQALARVTLAAWLSAAQEASERLSRDAAALGTAFGFDAGNLARIEAMGDPHAGGRRVLRLQDGGGVALYLKPRAPDGEQLLSRLASRLPEGQALAPVALLPRRSWFWMAEVAHAHRSGSLEQAGALLALADVAGAVDLHSENVRPTRAGPAVLDGEMALHPDLPLELVSPSGRAAARALRSGPLRTGMLPEAGGGAGPCGFSAWRPALAPCPAEIERVVLGYRRAFSVLIADAPPGALAAALGRQRGTVRLLARRTEGYSRLLAALRGTTRPLDPVGAFLVVETLRIGMARHVRRRPTLWPLPEAEQAALLRGDVPRLWMAWDAPHIAEGRTGHTGATLLQSPREQALARFASLQPAGLAARCACIRKTLSAGQSGAENH